MRRNPMPRLAGGSLAALALVGALLYFETRSPGAAARPVKLYCAASLRPAMATVAEDYARATGERVEIEYGDSGKMLGRVTIRSDGDLYLPADDSYVRTAESGGLVAGTWPLGRMRAVVLTSPGNPFGIRTLDDLLRPGARIGIPNPDRAAVGKVVRDHLAARGKWDALAERIDVQHFNVTDAANAVRIGSRDAAFVWDAVARNYRELAAVSLPELEGAVGRVELALLTGSADAARAVRFARYVAASDRGLARLREAGFADVEGGAPWNGGGP